VKAKKPSVQLSGIGTHQIDLKLVDAATRRRVIECIEKNGKISVMIGGDVTKGLVDGGFRQLID
jgi:hypothetical protein